MAENTEEKYTSISPCDVVELKDIYEDYLYMARHHELVFQRETVDELSFRAVHEMYPECDDPRTFTIPWYIGKLNNEERQEFADYVKNDIQGDGVKTYISMQHIKEEENNGRGPLFATEPYSNLGRTLQFPSMIEEYTISYPKGATLGNTEFYIDGRYKTSYLGDKNRDKLIADCTNDFDLVDEITVMLELGECFRRNGYVDDEKFGRMAVNVYASGVVGTNENNLLEMLGSFAEKIKNICHARYRGEDAESDIKRAQKDGFLSLPANFQDYINIRNFMRHQWDTLDDLDDFSIEKSQKNKRVRTERINSYLKLCDKSLYQRMVSYIEVLHQMQQVITNVDPYRLVRGMNESNNKFVERVKAVCRQNPNKQIEVEMNYPFESEKYNALNKILHKNKIFPNIKIVDDLIKDKDKLELMFDYEKRSTFLRNFHDVASYAMGYCQRRGEDKDSRGAWNYLKKIGLISEEECQKLQDYTSLRNNLVHNYFGKNIREQLKKIDQESLQDFCCLAKKLYETGPDVTKVQDDVYKYEHNDGKVTTLDYASHNREVSQKSSGAEEKAETKNEKFKSERKPKKEFYRNGVEFKTDNGKFVSIKFPNGVYVNMINRSVNFGNRTRWYSNSKYFSALQTERSTIRTDKELKVKSFFEGHRNISLRRGDNLLIDNRHSLKLDEVGRIKEFNFKNENNQIIKIRFKHLDANHQDLISFADGTSILLSDHDISVIHNNEVLEFDTRKKFAMTYDKAPITPQQSVKRGNGR